VYFILQLPEPNRNQLALGDTALGSVVDIGLRPPVEFDFKTRADVLRLREEAVRQHVELISGAYSPAETIFGQIEDNRPWWGLTGYFYYGSGDQSIEGPSEESRFLLNPFLLVGADFYHDWKGLSESEILRPGFALDCAPTQLRWYPRERRGEATYDAQCVARTNSRLFDLIAYNARDLNLNYLYVSYADSRNISKPDPPASAYAIPHYLHRGSSCGYSGGCNNMSPPTPEIDALQIDGFPAQVVIWLWQRKPNAISQAPDMVFVIQFS